MAAIFSTISIICFVLAFITLVVCVVLYFVLDVHNVYAELKGKKPVKRKKKDRKQTKAETDTYVEGENPTEVQDEAATVLENGEIDMDSLVGVYEPGTDVMEETVLEPEQPEATMLEDAEQPTLSEVQQICTMAAGVSQLQQPRGGFQIEKDIMLTDETKALYCLIG